MEYVVGTLAILLIIACIIFLPYYTARFVQFLIWKDSTVDSEYAFAMWFIGAIILMIVVGVFYIIASDAKELGSTILGWFN